MFTAAPRSVCVCWRFLASPGALNNNPKTGFYIHIFRSPHCSFFHALFAPVSTTFKLFAKRTQTRLISERSKGLTLSVRCRELHIQCCDTRDSLADTLRIKLWTIPTTQWSSISRFPWPARGKKGPPRERSPAALNCLHLPSSSFIYYRFVLLNREADLLSTKDRRIFATDPRRNLTTTESGRTAGVFTKPFWPPLPTWTNTPLSFIQEGRRKTLTHVVNIGHRVVMGEPERLVHREWVPTVCSERVWLMEVHSREDDLARSFWSTWHVVSISF